MLELCNFVHQIYILQLFCTHMVLKDIVRKYCYRALGFSAGVEAVRFLGGFDFDRSAVYSYGLPAFVGTCAALEALPQIRQVLQNRRDVGLEDRLLEESKNTALTNFVRSFVPEIPKKGANYTEMKKFEDLVESRVVLPDNFNCWVSCSGKANIKLRGCVNVDSVAGLLIKSVEARQWPSTVSAEASYEWQPDGFLKEEQISFPVDIKYEWKTMEPEPRINLNYKTHSVCVKLTDTRIEVSAEGDGRSYLSDIVKLLKPDVVHFEVTDKEKKLLQEHGSFGLAWEALKAAIASKEDIKEHYRTASFGKALGFNLEETTLLTITYAGFEMLQQRMGLNLLDSNTVRRVFRRYEKGSPQILKDAQILIGYLKSKETVFDTKHSVVTLGWAKDILFEELGSIEERLAGHGFGQGIAMLGSVVLTNLHLPAIEELKKLYGERFGVEKAKTILEKESDTNFSDYLQSIGYKPPVEWLKSEEERKKALQSIDDEISKLGYKHKENKNYDEPLSPNEEKYYALKEKKWSLDIKTPRIIHAVWFLKQLVNGDPDPSVIPYHASFRNPAPEWRIDGKIECPAQNFVDCEKPKYASVSVFRVKGPDWLNNRIDVGSYAKEEKDQVEIGMQFGPSTLHGLQNDVLNCLGVTFKNDCSIPCK